MTPDVSQFVMSPLKLGALVNTVAGNEQNVSSEKNAPRGRGYDLEIHKTVPNVMSSTLEVSHVLRSPLKADVSSNTNVFGDSS